VFGHTLVGVDPATDKQSVQGVGGRAERGDLGISTPRV
jgi:hypothetical protein